MAQKDYDVSNYSYVVVNQFWSRGEPATFGGNITIYFDGVYYATGASSATGGDVTVIGNIYDVRNVTTFSFHVQGNPVYAAGGGAAGIYAFT